MLSEYSNLIAFKIKRIIFLIKFNINNFLIIQKETFSIQKEFSYDFFIIRIKYKIINEKNEKSKLEDIIGSFDDEIILGENKFPFYQLIEENEFNGLIEVYKNSTDKIGNVKIKFFILDTNNLPNDNSMLENILHKNNNINNVRINQYLIIITII